MLINSHLCLITLRNEIFHVYFDQILNCKVSIDKVCISLGSSYADVFINSFCPSLKREKVMFRVRFKVFKY